MEIFTKGNGRIIQKMELGSGKTQKGTAISVNGKMDKLMELEPLLT
jgi:hypothetical protein